MRKILLALPVLTLLSACAGGLEDDYVVAGPLPPPAKPTPEVYVPAESLADDFMTAAGTNTVFFETDSAELTLQARDILQRQLAWIITHRDVPIRIEGHCDERNSREYNLALGLRRAEAVKAFFVAAGVRSSRIRTVSYGESSPVVPRNGDIPINRRAVTVVFGT